MFCYIHLPLVASDGVYILDNNPLLFSVARENTELIIPSARENEKKVVCVPTLA